MNVVVMRPALAVNEIFETIQGEAWHAGKPSLFIRLQGCDVGCPWCDTKHTWVLDPKKEVEAQVMMLKDNEPSDEFANLEVEQLVVYAAGSKCGHVVLTGGEPCTFNLYPLCERLLYLGKSVQIETSGTEPVIVPDRVWVTLSPKIEMPGGKMVRQQAINRANEIKMPVGKMDDINKLRSVLARRSEPPAAVWLQPLSMSEKATALCVDQATQNGWRVSIQTHKVMGVR